MKNKKLVILIISLVMLFPATYLIFNIVSSQINLDTNLVVIENDNNIKTNIKNETNVENSEPNSIPYLDFTLTSIDGRTISLSDYDGKPIVLNFWATWCPPCLEELPHFQKAENEYGDDVVFLFVNLIYEGGDTKEITENFLKDNNYNFENILLDENALVAEMYGIPGIPTTFFIDKAGSVISGFGQSLSEKLLEDNIQSILN